MTFDEIDFYNKLSKLDDQLHLIQQSVTKLGGRVRQLENHNTPGDGTQYWYLGLPGAAYATHENGDVYIGNTPGDGAPISPDRARQVARYLEAAADHAERTKE